MTQTLLAIENLSVGFRHQQTVRTVVNDVSLQIAAGETLALVGESGSGKSVTALSILRLLPCPPVEYLSGDIRFHGESLLHASDQTLRGIRGNKIAMIFQEPMVSLNPLHTLEKQLYEVLSLHRGMRREAARGEILNCLDRVGIRQAAKRLTDYPHQLSGGERQRVMIAMALLTRPELLIADEPTTALDVSVQAQILQLLRELQGELNMGMLFITHNLSIVRKLAHRVAVMQNGRCVEQNNAATLFASPTHPYTQKLLNSEPSGDPVPLPEPASTLLDVEQLQVAFPIRKGILKRIVDHNVVVKNISFTLRAGETLGLVGESGSGKSTVALGVERELHKRGILCRILDGDNIRSGINKNLGFSADDRKENIRRIAEIGKLFVDTGVVTLSAFISPTNESRRMASEIIGADDFREVYVSTPLEVCEQRDVKGLYARARRGEIKDFTGVSAPFEVPEHPALTLDTSVLTLEESVNKVSNADMVCCTSDMDCTYLR